MCSPTPRREGLLGGGAARAPCLRGRQDCLITCLGRAAGKPVAGTRYSRWQPLAADPSRVPGEHRQLDRGRGAEAARCCRIRGHPPPGVFETALLAGWQPRSPRLPSGGTPEHVTELLIRPIVRAVTSS